MENQYSLSFAKQEDIDSWMCLVHLVKEDFPGLLLDAYQQTLIKNISWRSAICVKKQYEVVGILLFSINNKTLSCMAVHPAHRQKGIATALVKKMIGEFPKNSEIWVTTFREDDPKGAAPRALYKKLGFMEDELTMEFEYPVQRFVLQRQQAFSL